VAIEFSCEQCGRPILADQSVGTRVVCPACHGEVTVPDPGTAPVPPGREPGVPPAGSHAPPANPAAPPTPSEPPLEPADADREGALSERTVQVLTACLPWGISLALHASIFLVLFFSFAARDIVANSDVERIIIPDARLSDTPGGVINPSAGSPDLRSPGAPLKARMHEYRIQPTKDLMARAGSGGGSGGGVGAGSGPGSGGGTGPGKGGDLKIIGIGVGGGGGPAVGQGLGTGGGGDGPRTAFYGSGGNAYKVCYVIDRSGSMLDAFDYLRDELKRSIRDLVAQQQFHVVFFSAGRPEELPPGKLVNATQANKEKAFKYLDTVVPGGQTQPGPALERAFACKPELIYLMTDGDFDSKVIDTLRRLNRDKKVKINTFSFIFKPGEALLKQIASEHGGRYKHVSEDDLSQ
jgi:hypothetical protein